jgi:ABC-type transport system substrate-binding protein
MQHLLHGRLVKRALASVAMLAAGSLLLTAAGVAALHGERRSGARPRGTLHIAVRHYVQIDPARAFGGITGGWADPVADATCALLMRYPDKSPPTGYRPVPGAATGYPKVSRDGKTYTFTIRQGLRFSNGDQLTARNFAWAIKRALAPATQGFPPEVLGMDTLVGVPAFNSGQARTLPGIRASGNRLIFKLAQRTPDLPARLTSSHLCPVPLGLPISGEGVTKPFPGSGPYYIASFVREREVVLKPNRFYGGGRPRHLARIVITVAPDRDSHDIVRAVEANSIDTTNFVPPDMINELAGRFGVNKSRFRIVPGLIVWYVIFNVPRPLFASNPSLRRAINFAIDRRALLRELGPRFGNTTDQYIPPRMPGFRNATIYPLARPNLGQARALAKGHLRSRKTVLYAASDGVSPSLAQTVQQNLSKIGLQVEVKQAASIDQLTPRDARWDMYIGAWQGQWMDPIWYVDFALKFQSGIDSRAFVKRVTHANSLAGAERYKAYGNADVWIARNEPPMAAFAVQNTPHIFSSRVGCMAFNYYSIGGGFDLAAACLKR